MVEYVYLESLKIKQLCLYDMMLQVNLWPETFAMYSGLYNIKYILDGN